MRGFTLVATCDRLDPVEGVRIVRYSPPESGVSMSLMPSTSINADSIDTPDFVFIASHTGVESTCVALTHSAWEAHRAMSKHTISPNQLPLFYYPFWRYPVDWGKRSEELWLHPYLEKQLRERGYTQIQHEVVLPRGRADFIARAPDGTVCVIEAKRRIDQLPERVADQVKRYASHVSGAKPVVAAPLAHESCDAIDFYIQEGIDVFAMAHHNGILAHQMAVSDLNGMIEGWLRVNQFAYHQRLPQSPASLLMAHIRQWATDTEVPVIAFEYAQTRLNAWRSQVPLLDE